MSATQLAAFVVAATVAAGLAALAVRLVWAARAGERVRFNLAAAAVGALALFVMTAGTIAATSTTRGVIAPAGSAWTNRCEPGTYDNGGDRYDGPVCVPWPSGGPR